MGGQQSALLNRTKEVLFSEQRGRVYVSNEETGDDPDPEKARYLQKVTLSLQKFQFPGHGLGPNETADMAECLIDEKRMKEKWFWHLLQDTDQAVAMVQEEARDFPDGYRNIAESKEGRRRIEGQVRRLEKLEVKLLIYRLGEGVLRNSIAFAFNRYVREFSYGPYHAALVIGNVLLDWNASSLVLPTVLKSDCDDGTLILATNVHEGSSQHGAATEVMPMQAGATCPRDVFERQVQIVGEISQEKQTLINALVETAVRYNRKHTYGLFTNNCQHFVVDALTVLGIRDPTEAFRGKLRQHAELVMQ